MVLSGDSLTWRPTLIEIEAPGKRLFTAKGTTRSEFNQARDQISEWHAWFNKNANDHAFRVEYGISSEGTLPDAVQLECVLVYGRKYEWERHPELAGKRSVLFRGAGDSQASFDRLAERLARNVHLLYDAITVKPIGHGRFRALYVAPTFGFSPSKADRLLWIDGLSDAINDQPEIPDDRKRFLKQRLSYWTDWATRGARGLISSGDIE